MKVAESVRLTRRLVRDSLARMKLNISRKARQIIDPLIGALIIVYFVYHAVQGDRGLMAWWNLRYEIEKTNFERDEVSATKHALKQRVSLLRPESLDRDMLEERARLMLGAIAADELIVPLGPARGSK